MFDAEPTFAELISSRKRLAQRPFHQWNTQASNATPWKRIALRHQHPTTHITAQEELPRKKAATNSTEQGGMPKPKKVRQPKKKTRPSSHPNADKTNHLIALKHLPRPRTNPPAQRRMLTSTLYSQTTMYRRSPTDARARFDHTDILHTWQLLHGNLHSMSPTKHLD